MTAPVPPRAVVFDLDGTLFDSLPLVLAAIAHAIEPFGARPTMEIFARLGGPPNQFMPALVGDPRNVPDALQRMERFHLENFHLIQPFPGAAELLARLRARGVAAAYWTGRDRKSADILLRGSGLAPLLATGVCGDDLPTHKPDPAGLREILARLRVEAAETLFIGDADVDVLGGAACGVNTILIRHARTVAPEILAGAWRVMDSAPAAFEAVLADGYGDS
jgi:phosphoglycolate phosphatase-like HAD superfamily hydrolase